MPSAETPKHKWPEDYTNCYSQTDLDSAVSTAIERCAKVADEYAVQSSSEGWTGYRIAPRTAQAIATAIRALSTGGKDGQ